LIAWVAVGLSQAVSLGQSNPLDFGQIVNGFQDDFLGPSRNAYWVPGPGQGDAYQQKNGLLEITTLAGDPNHLIYAAPDYQPVVQEVLARIRILHFGGGSQSRAGIAIGIDAATSQGINLLFADFEPGNPYAHGVEGPQFKLLDDLRAWGPPGIKLQWKTNTWYWLCLRQTAEDPAQAANIKGKAWLADGTVPEPEDWSLQWSRPARSGFAGILASSGGLAHFEVDYFLLKADGLPKIKVGPILTLVKEPESKVIKANQSITLHLATGGSAQPSYQWQQAGPGAATFRDIAGATTASLTTALLTQADNSTRYRCLVSAPEGRLISQEAIVTVDTQKPILLSARTLGNPNRIKIFFSEAVLPTASPLDFSIDNGIQVRGVAQGVRPDILEVETTPIGPEKTYTLTVNRIQDLAGNEITPNSSLLLDLSVEVPLDFRQIVSGFQDDFTGAERDPHWRPVPPDSGGYLPTNGFLKVSAKEGGVTHLLYVGPDYAAVSQEVLARIRVNTFSAHRNAQAGIGVGINAQTGEGINLTFRDGNQSGVFGRQITLYDDYLGWGPPVLDIPWESQTWYWLRLRQSDLGASGQSNIQCKFWKADGTVPEPPAWQFNWEQDRRAGRAGILGPNPTAPADFEIDYILIKAEGLPRIKAGCNAFALIPP
jgi:hypothetical protein